MPQPSLCRVRSIIRLLKVAYSRFFFLLLIIIMKPLNSLMHRQMLYGSRMPLTRSMLYKALMLCHRQLLNLVIRWILAAARLRLKCFKISMRISRICIEMLRMICRTPHRASTFLMHLAVLLLTPLQPLPLRLRDNFSLITSG